MATNKVAKMGQNYLPPALRSVIPTRNGIMPCMCMINPSVAMVFFKTYVAIGGGGK